MELNGSRITAFTQIMQTDYLSKRFMLKKYLGLSDIEIKENEKMWHEERGEGKVETQLGGSDLRTVGVTPGAINTDLETISDIESAGGGVPGGAPGAPPVAGAQGEVGAGGIGSPTGGAGGAQGGATAGAALGGI